MSEPSAPAPARPLLRLHDGGIAGGACAVGVEHALTLRWMHSMLPQVAHVAPAIVGSMVELAEQALTGEASVRDLRSVGSFLARVQANPHATREERDALTCALLAAKVAMVLTGDRVERTGEIREAFVRAMAGCGVQVICPAETIEDEEDPQCFGW